MFTNAFILSDREMVFNTKPGCVDACVHVWVGGEMKGEEERWREREGEVEAGEKGRDNDRMIQWLDICKRYRHS